MQITNLLNAQKLSIGRYEIFWAIKHPFIAKKAFKITKKAKQIAINHITDPDLDGDYNGGQVDAFRHALWMAMLVQEISPKAAKSLGIAHEKTNYRYYLKHKNEDGSLPDEISTKMDLLNNEVGLELGQIYMGASTDTLIQVVKVAIREGKCWIIKKNSLGDFLDENDNIIPISEIKGKWRNRKVLVPSNYPKPKI